MSECQACGAATIDVTLCPNDRNRLRNTLTDLGEAWTESLTTLTRQDVKAMPGKTRNSDRSPLPLNVGMMERRDEARDTIKAWTLDLCHGHISRQHQDVPGMLQQLLGRLDAAAVHQHAGKMLDELIDCLHRLRQPTDIPQPRNYLGFCECGSEVWAKTDQHWVKCSCGVTIDLGHHRDTLRDQLADMIATPGEIEAMCKQLFGEYITVSMIRGYAHRGTIAARGKGLTIGGKAVPAYRVGDVMDAAVKASLSPSERRAARRDARAASA